MKSLSSLSSQIQELKTKPVLGIDKSLHDKVVYTEVLQSLSIVVRLNCRTQEFAGRLNWAPSTTIDKLFGKTNFCKVKNLAHKNLSTKNTLEWYLESVEVIQRIVWPNKKYGKYRSNLLKVGWFGWCPV